MFVAMLKEREEMCSSQTSECLSHPMVNKSDKKHPSACFSDAATFCTNQCDSLQLASVVLLIDESETFRIFFTKHLS